MSPAAATKIITTDKGKNRQRVEKWRNKQKHDDATNSVTESNSSLAYNSPSTLGKAAAKVSRALPNSPKKKKAVLLKIVQDHGLQTELSKTNVTPSTSIKSKLSQDTISAVEQFYIRDDISRQAPGMKDCIAIKNAEGIKEKLQIRHLYSSIKETHALFVNENGAIIGKTKFAQLRPKNVLFGNKLPHNVCLCRYHENYIMAVKAMHDSVPLFPQYNHTFAQSVLCENTEELQCWLGKCTVCSEFLKNKIIECVNASHSLPPEVTWHTWKDVDGKLSKIVETGTLDDLTNHIVEMTPQFFEHCYVKRSQSNAYNSDRMVASSDKYDPGGAMVQVDFAENYTCVAQDEIQSFHWMQPQVTLFTVSMWYNRKQLPVVIVSDNRNHNRDTAVVYIDRVLKKLPDTIKEVHMWSDGPASQFKNRFIAAALNVLEKRSGKTIVWNYFATSHGKGPVDGIGVL